MRELEQQRAEQIFQSCREEMIQTICRLVSIDSTRGEAKPNAPYGFGPAQALETLLEQARKLGFRVKNYQGYVGTVDFGPEEPGLDILNHLDVVPGGEGWTITQPFQPLVLDGRIYGRGAADNKGPAVTVLYALYALASAGVRPRKRVRLLWGCAEETGAEDILHYYAQEPYAPMTLSPDAAFPVISSEKGRIECHFSCPLSEGFLKMLQGGATANAVPSSAWARLRDWNLENLRQAQGAIEEMTGTTFTFQQEGEDVVICAHGKGAHAASPAKGCNALTALLRLLVAVGQSLPQPIKALAHIFPPNGPLPGISWREGMTATLSMLSLEAGRLQGVCDLRFSPGSSLEEIKTELFGILEANGFQVDPQTRASDAHSVPEDSDFVKKLLRCYEAENGPSPGCRAIAGNTYAHGIPGAVAFGFAHPDIRTNTHGPDEYVSLEQLEFGGRVYLRTIQALCG